MSRSSRIESETAAASKAIGAPSSIEQKAVEIQLDAARIERHARVTGRRDDSAPVRIAAGDRRFHQRAVGHRPGDLAGRVAIGAAAALRS